MHSILVIDDEFGIAEVLEALLSDAGFRVSRAINGEQGLERLHEGRVDIVLLDMMMPLMDGPETLRAIRALPAHQAVPVILMSGLTRSTAMLKVDAPVQGYLQKPFLANDLFQAIQDALGAREP
ncbi:MAG TPA: response regulator [Nevskiaceae bacterium]|nr:response regulator [Nevskiaceae bacterium]